MKYINENSLKKLKVIEESPHKNDALLNKNIPRNKEYRDLFAEKLRFLSKKVKINKTLGKEAKANVIDNVSRSLTRAGSNDPIVKMLSKIPLKHMNPEDRKDILTYVPKTTVVPHEKFEELKKEGNVIGGQAFPNVDGNKFYNDNDLKKIQTAFKQQHDRGKLSLDILKIFENKPRMASVIRERHPLLDYNTPTRYTKFYNLKDPYSY